VNDAENIVCKLLEGEEIDWTPIPGDPDMPNQGTLDAATKAAQAAELRKEFARAFKGAFQQPEIEEADYFDVRTSHGDSFIVPAFVHDPGPVPAGPDTIDLMADEVQEAAQDAYQEYVDSFRDYRDEYAYGDPESVERKHGFVYRTSAPGYMDSSPWCAAETEEEAMQDLIDNYGDEPEEGEGEND
jgi:hypothetical protein